MHKIKKPCGFHCIKMKDIGVSFGDQVVLEHINLHIHCGSLDGAHRTKWCGKVYPAQGDLRGTFPYGKYYFFRYRKWKNEKNEDRVCRSH